MKTPHKHAEILRAIANGDAVEYRENNWDKWTERPDSYIEPDPITRDDWEWRVKPEPKPDAVIFVCAAKNWVAVSETRHSDHNIQLTFDGETGALKAAEVLK